MTSQLRCVFAPRGWAHTDPNPFTADGAYGREWSAFCIQDRDDDQYFTGRDGVVGSSQPGPFSARFGRRVPQLQARLADFLRYESRHRRTVILSFPAEADPQAYVTQALACTPPENIVRPEDPPVLVHATTLSAWAAIQADGALKAASLLTPSQAHRDGLLNPIEEYLRREPAEYSDYIMFGEVDSYGPEMVVASYRAGTFIYDVNNAFEPGVRLYFDNHRILRDGLGTRDGLHVMKVHRQLPLQPYLIAAVGVNEMNPGGEVQRWTLKEFVDGANQVFRAQVK